MLSRRAFLIQDLFSGLWGAVTRIPAYTLIKAIVSRGGRPDLAGKYLPQVEAPTLLIVGENDEAVIEMNQDAMAQMVCHVKLEIVPGATHLFEEHSTLEQAAELAKAWFLQYLR